jgi:hypothetical protein
MKFGALFTPQAPPDLKFEPHRHDRLIVGSPDDVIPRLAAGAAEALAT